LEAIKEMKLFFEPESVALIGASSRPLRPGHSLFMNMNICFGDRFYPVNPNVDKIDGKVCYKSILDVPAEIDVAVIFIPAGKVPAALEQCAEKGIKRVIIESAGFAEVGQEGMKLEEQCLAIGKEAGMRLWGPNCMGMINVHQTKVLSFMIPFMWQGRFIKGKVSLVVQSGMMSAGFLMHILSRTPFGLSKVASIGNKMNVDDVDILEYLVNDSETAVIAMYLESIERGRRFFELARACEKPVVVLKGGRSALGARAAMSHTASLAQDDRVLDAALRQAQVIRVHGMNELMDVARCLGLGPVDTKRSARLAVISFSGSAGVVAGDDMADMGMELASLRPETLSELKSVFPDWMEPSNPVDIYPAIEKHGPKHTVERSLDAVLKDPGVDAVYVHLFAPPIKMPLFDYGHLARMIKFYKKPVVAWIMGHRDTLDEITKELEKNGIPVVEDVGKGVRILAALTMRR
jgi:acyl-CoA synthetase (NDP forming)